MAGSRRRVMEAFAHRVPDRTPLFEIFQPGHPIHWDICGRTIATDMAMQWDAYAQAVSPEEMIEAKAEAVFNINRFFGLDMIHFPPDPPASPEELEKTGRCSWRLDGVEYLVDERTKLVVPAEPGALGGYSTRQDEAAVRRQIEQWDGAAGAPPPPAFAVYRKVRRMAQTAGLDWVYMAEIGGGTAAAFFPPFQLMWFLTDPELLRRWTDMQTARVLPLMKHYIDAGCAVVAMGGDVSCDKGPFISPAHYREFILPAIRRQVDFIHSCGALAVYTSDGNHWPIKEDFFYNSGIDGYKEVDRAAGMTFERLIAEGVAGRVCIIGEMDARHLMCHGGVEEVKRRTRRCLDLGRDSGGGHILHLSHSVHEDVRVENYYAMIEAYREYFGLGALGG